MIDLRHAAVLLLSAIPLSAFAAPPQAGRSPEHQAVTGPRGTMNEALATGATATMTLQPVQPKTVPASNYPTGTIIMNEAIYLGSVPARVWLELHVTGWAPESLVCVQARIDALDLDGDGGGFDGDNADCNGTPVEGAGDLLPAVVSCNGGTCQGNPMVTCLSPSDCTDAGTTGPCNFQRVCSGNPMVPCVSASDCTAAGVPGGCIPQGFATCRAALSGLTSSCPMGEPAVCTKRPDYFPPGGSYVCTHGFFDGCDPEFVAMGVGFIPAFDLATLNARWAVFVNDPGPEASFTDFAPSYSGTVVIDVPANAKGRYVIDFKEDETFILKDLEPFTMIPIAALYEAEIKVGHCSSHMDCDDNDACTVESCEDGCCVHTPVADWNQATECCHPISGMQVPIPPSTSCRTGGCSHGGSSGSPTTNSLPDGTACESGDPCYTDGECSAGQCVGDQYAGPECPKPRFISFDVDTGTVPSAYRVRMVSLHHPDPPYSGGPVRNFDAYEGLYRWVGAPATFVESTANPTPVHAAYVGCEPHYRDWSPIDLLHVSGAEIVPSSVYEVQSIAQGLDVNVEANYSAPISIATARWADVILPYSPPNATAQPNASDHAALVNKFRSGSGAMSKPRAMLTGSGMSGIPSLTSDVGFAEISAAVDAYRGLPYPYAGPIPCQ